MGDSREHDFRMLLRVLRERVVDATGLLEDGSALGVAGQVQGRVLDSPEFLPLARAGGKDASQCGGHRPGARSARTGRCARCSRAAAADASAKITAAPDLIAAATHAASQALGWTSPEAALASTLAPPAPPAGAKKPARKTAAKKGPAPLPTPSRSSCRRCRRTTGPRWSSARRSIAATWCWRGRSSTRTARRSGSPRSPTARR